MLNEDFFLKDCCIITLILRMNELVKEECVFVHCVV